MLLYLLILKEKKWRSRGPILLLLLSFKYPLHSHESMGQCDWCQTGHGTTCRQVMNAPMYSPLFPLINCFLLACNRDTSHFKFVLEWLQCKQSTTSSVPDWLLPKKWLLFTWPVLYHHELSWKSWEALNPHQKVKEEDEIHYN